MTLEAPGPAIQTRQPRAEILDGSWTFPEFERL